MAWAPLLLALLTYCSGVRSQPVVTQEPSMSVTPGGAVTLSCSLSTGAITSSNYPAWYQQKPGSAPQLLIYNTNSRPSGIPDRFSGAISGNKAALTITGVQAADEADYYCSVWASSAHHIVDSGLKTPIGPGFLANNEEEDGNDQLEEEEERASTLTISLELNCPSESYWEDMLLVCFSLTLRGKEDWQAVRMATNKAPLRGVRSQPVVTQEPSMSVTPGGAVTLSCSLSTGAITSGNYPYWYQQKPGSVPHTLIYDTNSRPSGIPAWFSGAISSNDAALTITGVQAEDEADYYCSIWTGSAHTVIQSNGELRQKPTMTPSPPSLGIALRGRN
ncbi:uncharacterized protein LOC102446550 [Pelodiscus sinensis]|uniref:uncharacterized protein LOC102446550 n=1 Tax=Pelodiscus sinensis TaxID=13735 RepID=UPI003F6AF969